MTEAQGIQCETAFGAVSVVSLEWDAHQIREKNLLPRIELVSIVQHQRRESHDNVEKLACILRVFFCGAQVPFSVLTSLAPIPVPLKYNLTAHFETILSRCVNCNIFFTGKNIFCGLGFSRSGFVEGKVGSRVLCSGMGKNVKCVYN